MKKLALLWILSCSLAIAGPPLGVEKEMDLDSFEVRCYQALLLRNNSIPGDKAKRLRKSHPSGLYKLSRYWDAKATKELTVTLQYLAVHGGTKNSDLMEEQYDAFYLDHIEDIEATLDALAKTSAEVSTQ